MVNLIVFDAILRTPGCSSGDLMRKESIHFFACVRIPEIFLTLSLISPTPKRPTFPAANCSQAPGPTLAFQSHCNEQVFPSWCSRDVRKLMSVRIFVRL